jgi:hypothetical protein
MLKHESFKGLFFLPRNPDNKVPGELRFTYGENIRLELYSSFFQTTEDYKNDRKEDAIWGIDFKGDTITLINCETVSSTIVNWTSLDKKLNSSVNAIATYNAEIIFKGSHLNNTIDNRFYEMRADIDYLTDWVQPPWASVSQSKDFKGFNIEYEQPDDIAFKITDLFMGEIAFTHILPTNSSFELKPKCYLKIYCPDNKTASFNDFRLALWRFQNMLSFITINKARVTSLELLSYDSTTVLRGGLVIPNAIKVFYIQSQVDYVEFHSSRFLFKYLDIVEQFETLVNKWYLIQEEITPIISLLYNSLGEEIEFNQSNFLDIVQAVEAYHRRKLQNNNLLKQPDKQRKEEIYSQIQSKEHVDWLKSKLAYSFEPSLRDRLKEMFASTDSLLFYNPAPDKINTLIGHIVNTRNYYTHYDKSLEHKKLRTSSMIAASKLLRTLLMIFILRDLNLSSQLIAKAIKGEIKFKLPDN